MTPRVLIVDDEPQVLNVLKDLVVSLGYTVVTANRAASAIAAVSAEPRPDAVLLDMTMPGSLNGLEALQVIKAHHPDLPVIMVTANIDEELARAALREGALDYIMKPLNIARLREVLAAAMLMIGKTPPS